MGDCVRDQRVMSTSFVDWYLAVKMRCVREVMVVSPHYPHYSPLPIIINYLQTPPPPLPPSRLSLSTTSFVIFISFLLFCQIPGRQSSELYRGAKFGLFAFYCPGDLLSVRRHWEETQTKFNGSSWSEKCLSSQLSSAILMQKWLESSHEVKIRNIYCYFKVRSNY